MKLELHIHWLYNCTTPFPPPSAGDGVAEAFICVPLTSQNAPPAAQLQAPSHLVARGWETAPWPPSVGAGQWGSSHLCDMTLPTTNSHLIWMHVWIILIFPLTCSSYLPVVLKLQRAVPLPAFDRPNGAFAAFSSTRAAPLGSETPWQPVLSDTLHTRQSSLRPTGRGWAAKKPNIIVMMNDVQPSCCS